MIYSLQASSQFIHMASLRWGTVYIQWMRKLAPLKGQVIFLQGMCMIPDSNSRPADPK